MICTSLLMLCSCESSSVRDGRKLYESYLHKFAIVPDEIKIYNECYTEDENKKVHWTIDVGGVDKGGRHFRQEMKFETVSDIIIIDGDIYNKNELEQ